MKKRAEAKALLERLTQERNSVYAAQMVKWHAAATPFEAWKKWMCKGEVMSRREANTALAVQETLYNAMK